MGEVRRQKLRLAFSWLLGAATAALALSLLVLALARSGRLKWEPNPWAQNSLKMPPEMLEELKAIRGGVENAGNPTKAERHSADLSIPDAEIGCVPKPDVVLKNYVLRDGTEPFVNRPVMVFDARKALSEKMRRYCEDHSFYSYECSIGPDGFRRTLPETNSDKRMLMVGDSVCFGSGVGDADTIASQLQAILKGKYKVCNAGYCGYDAEQALKYGLRQARGGRYDGLIYICCENDLHAGLTDAAKRLDKFKELADLCGGRAIVLLHTYLSYNARYYLRDRSPEWSAAMNDYVDKLRPLVKDKCGELRFGFIDWVDIVDKFRASSKTTFAPFMLYTDFCHPSALGNKLMAERLAETVRNEW